MAAEQWVTGIQHIGIPTSDIEKTIRFYEKLGFQAYGEIEYEEHCPHTWMKKIIT